jgi:L-asparaginase
MQSQASKVVILGTGGTIAGTAADPQDHIGYRAGQIGVAQLVEALPMLAGQPLETEQVAQIDSKDMSIELWLALARRLELQLQRGDVCGAVVTHGTDTLEETAYFLQRVLAPRKPVVLTAAMRPSTALLRDGPQNLLDAVGVARADGACGVVAVLAGAVHGAYDVRKVHSHRIDAFGSGDAGPLARVADGRLRLLRDWPRGDAIGADRLPADPARWPAVEIVMSHAAASALLVDAAAQAGVAGLIVAGTGNGSLHHRLEAALLSAARAGMRVWRCTRCADGQVLGRPDDVLPSAGALTPVQARIELQLQLLGAAPAR